MSRVTELEKALTTLFRKGTEVGYLMAALFNSVSTIDNHYAMLVNHDFHGGP